MDFFNKPLSPPLTRVVDWRTEVHPDDVDGRPDIGVVTDGLLNGHVELKAPVELFPVRVSGREVMAGPAETEPVRATIVTP